MKNAYVDVGSLKKLFVSCKAMEEVYLCAGRHALVCRHACDLVSFVNEGLTSMSALL